MNEHLGLYLHIPFCVKKCGYCDFYSGVYDQEKGARYYNALLSEFGRAKESGRLENYTIDTVYIGGGTPSIIPPEMIRGLLQDLRDKFHFSEDAEISMEANPGTVTREKLRVYKEAGINRLSIGLQSTDDRLLKLLGRIHDYRTFLNSYVMAREAGFDNINIDLIFGIPGQSVEDWELSLVKTAKLSPDHLSAYSLIVEEETPFAGLYGERGTKKDELPSEEAERQMYHLTEEVLKSYGFSRYEISNYAKEGKICRHNWNCWSYEPYIGFGAAAASFFEGKRFRNVNSLDFGRFSRKDAETLDTDDQMNEYMLLGLRKIPGVSDEEFKKRFGISLFERFRSEISYLKKNGLLKQEEDRVFLTARGLDLANQVFLCFV